jgi:hypothetical protein
MKWWAMPVLMACSTCVGAQSAEHVIIIGVDGLSPRGVDASVTPVMNRLIRGGAYTFEARGVFPTSSAANWASMLMGAGPEFHGVRSNDWRRWNGRIVPAATSGDDLFPTVFDVVRAARPDAHIAVIYDWDGIAGLFDPGAVDADISTDGPEATASAAASYFAEHTPTLMFVHLDHVDGAGHASGWHTDAYYEAVERADRAIGMILDAVRDSARDESTAVIISSDHGGVGTSHGGESMDELLIPWIISGAGVAEGRRITRPVSTMDTAVTAADLLGVPAHSAWIGRPVREAYAGGTAPEGDAVEEPYVPAPRITPSNLTTVSVPVRVAMSSEEPGASIRYTTEDGAQWMTYGGPIEIERTTTITAVASTSAGDSRETSASVRVLAPIPGRGVRYRLYPGTFEMIPDIDSLEPFAEGVVPEFGLIFIEPGSESFAARFEADLDVIDAGTYTFFLGSDDGSRLRVNSRVLISNDGRHGELFESARIDMTPGVYRLVVDYFDGGGGESLTLEYERDGMARRPIPTERLSPAE